MYSNASSHVTENINHFEKPEDKIPNKTKRFDLIVTTYNQQVGRTIAHVQIALRCNSEGRTAHSLISQQCRKRSTWIDSSAT